MNGGGVEGRVHFIHSRLVAEELERSEEDGGYEGRIAAYKVVDDKLRGTVFLLG